MFRTLLNCCLVVALLPIGVRAGDPRETRQKDISWTPKWIRGGSLNRLEVGNFDGMPGDEILFHYANQRLDGATITRDAAVTWNESATPPNFKHLGSSPSGFGRLSLPEDSLIRVGDFDGDGKDDILVNYFDGAHWITHFFKYQKASECQDIGCQDWEFVYFEMPAPEIQGPGLNGNLVIGDFNGDGRDDIWIRLPVGQAVYDKIYLSTGSGFASPTNDVSPFGYVDRLRVGDFDHDGKDEIIATWPSNGGWNTERYGYNNGHAELAFRYPKGIKVGGAAADFEVGDFNGDGFRDDVFVHSMNNGVWSDTFYTRSSSTDFKKYGPVSSRIGSLGSSARMRVGNFAPFVHDQILVYQQVNGDWIAPLYRFTTLPEFHYLDLVETFPVTNNYSVLIIKADDFWGDMDGDNRQGSDPSTWRMFTDTIQKLGIKASIGVTAGFPKPSATIPPELIAAGNFEFWNHGLHCAGGGDSHCSCTDLEDLLCGGIPDKAEYLQSLAFQRESFVRSQNYDRSILDLSAPTAFGPVGNAANADTAATLRGTGARARNLKAARQVSVVFYLPGHGNELLCLADRVFMGSENVKTILAHRNADETGAVESAATFRQAFHRRNLYDLEIQPEYIAYQLHPDMWEDESLVRLQEVIAFMDDRDAIFMNATEYATAYRPPAPIPFAQVPCGQSNARK